MIPKVSIGIPAYKPEFLEEAIASVLAQTFEDWELIVVDDCSPGDIRGIVGKFTDPRIRYYRNEKNLGAEDPSYNWDKCVEYAQGEYFCLLCDDDLYHPEFLEEMLKLTDQFPDCNVFRARAQYIDRDGNVTEKYPSSPLWESCEDYIWHKTRDLRFQTISEWMLKTEHIKQCGGYTHFPCAYAADVMSIYRFSLLGGIASSYKILMDFRRSGLNISTYSKKNLIQKLDALLMKKEQTMMLIQENCLNPELYENVRRRQRVATLFLLNHVGLLPFLKVAILKRKKYEIDCKTVITCTIKKIIHIVSERKSY